MESTLSLKREDFAAEVGLFLGYGRGDVFGDTAWSTSQEAAIDSCVNSGLRNFYFPPPLPGEQGGYSWSFLKPFVSMTLANGESTFELPDDFGGFEGNISITGDNSQYPIAIDLYNEGQVALAFARDPSRTGPPEMASLQILRGTTLNKSQRTNLYVFPTANADYTLCFAYYILPDALKGDRPYAYGSMHHHETILESCLAIAEQRLDDSSAIHSAKFMERLAASVALDRRNKEQKIGYNGDNSDDRYLYRDRRNWDGYIVTFNGITPD